MHSAPPVHVRVGPSRRWMLGCSALAAAAAANGVSWIGLHAQWPAWWIAAAAAAALCGGLTAAALQRRSVAVALAWDGAQWSLDGEPACVRLALDLDGWLLLEVTPTARPRRWLAVSRACTLGPWAALRAALYSGRTSDAADTPPA